MADNSRHHPPHTPPLLKIVADNPSLGWPSASRDTNPSPNHLSTPTSVSTTKCPPKRRVRSHGSDGHTDSVIPTAPTVFHNVNSVSAHPTIFNGIKHQRASRIRSNTRALQAKFGLVSYLDTRLRVKDRWALQGAISKGSKIYYSNFSSRQAGVLTIVSPYFVNNYDIEQVDLGREATGRVLALLLSPKPTSRGAEKKPFYNVAVYLTPGAKHTERAAQLSTLLSLCQGIHTTVGGDFNFIETEDDTTDYSDYYTLPDRFLETWRDVKHHLGLFEVHQPVHTHHHSTGSTRLDRIYINLPEADHTRFHPIAYIPVVPFLTFHTRFNNDKSKDGTGAPDHLPVGIYYDDFTKKGRGRTIPRWIATSKTFAATVTDQWLSHDLSKWGLGPDGQPIRDLHDTRVRHAFVARRKFVALIHQVAQAYRRDNSLSTYNDELSMLSGLVQAKRLLDDVHPDNDKLRKLTMRHPHLGHLLSASIPEARTRVDAEIEEIVSTADDNDNFLSGHKRPRHPDWHHDDYRVAPRRPRSNAIQALKHSLPSCRRGLTSISPSEMGTPTSDPKEMGRIIKAEWGPTWCKRLNQPSDPFAHPLIRDYHKEVPLEFQPAVPDVEDMLAVIEDSNNSSPGPDGVPFAIYRNVAVLAAPILQAVAEALADGHAPPKNYNLGKLFLIPKTASPWARAMRPISVTNADNRLVAKAFARAIGPALNAILHPAQKGFIPGRLGTEHIHDLNKRFYGALEKGDPYHLLFVDVKKAFDSIDHSFILHTIERAGLPNWLQNVVRGFLHKAAVYPIVAGNTNCLIPVTRGVKQGCPLSPLLFVLCYDPLLEALGATIDLCPNPEATTQNGFADDLAGGSPDLPTLLDMLSCVETFGTISGLCLHPDKTILVSTHELSASELSNIARSKTPWLKPADRGTYLGLQMGRDVTSVDIFRRPFDKFCKRIGRYYTALKHMPLRGRITTVNIFLTSLFTYHAHFYIVPWKEILQPAKELIRKAVIPFGGTGWAYHHLLAKTKDFGFSRQLKDLWAFTMSLLATQRDLRSQDGLHRASFDHSAKVDDKNWGSMIIDEHIDFAATHFCNDYAPRHPDGSIDTSYLATPSVDQDDPKVAQRMAATRQRNQIQAAMISAGWHSNRFGPVKRNSTSLPTRIASLGVPDRDAESAATKAYDNYNMIPRQTPPFIKDTYLRFFFNALPTHHRLAKSNIPVSPGPCPENPYPCPACTIGTYDTRHLLVCPVIHRAWSSTLSYHGLHQPSASPADLRNSLLMNYRMGPDSPHPGLTAAFVWALWTELQRKVADDSKDFIQRVSELAATQWDSVCAARQTKKDKKRKRADAFYTLHSTFAPGDLVIYTDGSADPNPGPCGAGISCTLADGTAYSLTACLGAGSNNLGELWAIGMALQFARLLFSAGRWKGKRLRICSDSEYAVNAIRGHSTNRSWASSRTPTRRPKSNQALICHLRDFYQATARRFSVFLHTLPGHAGIAGNELADAAADSGSAASSRGEGLDTDSRSYYTTQGHFILTPIPTLSYTPALLPQPLLPLTPAAPPAPARRKRKRPTRRLPTRASKRIANLGSINYSDRSAYSNRQRLGSQVRLYDNTCTTDCNANSDALIFDPIDNG